MSAPSSAVNMRRVTGPLTSRGRRHEVARQSFAFERDLDRLDALGHVRRRLDERLARGAPPLLRRAAERIGEIFRRPVIHGGEQEMVARADALPAAKDGGHARGSSLPMAARAAKISPTSPPPKLAAPSQRMSWKSISGLWNPAIRVRVRSTRDMAKY